MNGERYTRAACSIIARLKYGNACVFISARASSPTAATGCQSKQNKHDPKSACGCGCVRWARANDSSNKSCTDGHLGRGRHAHRHRPATYRLRKSKHVLPACTNRLGAIDNTQERTATFLNHPKQDAAGPCCLERATSNNATRNNSSIEAYTKLNDCRVRHRDPLADKCVYLRAVEASSIEGSRLRPHTQFE